MDDDAAGADAGAHRDPRGRRRRTSTLRRALRDGWYDPVRGEFRGFAELTDETTGDTYTEPATHARRYDLGQTDDARGLQLVAAETRSPRGVLVREEHTLAVDSPAAGVRAVRRVATDTYHVEAGPESAAVRVRTEWGHDDWGNVIEERALGRVDRETAADIPGDERITTTTYATPRTEDGPRTRTAEQAVTDADGAQITASRTYYARWRSITLAPGVTLDRELDHTGRVLGQDMSAGTRTLLHLAHRYDAAGQLAETRDDLTAEGFTLAQTFVYDDLSRLVGHTADGKSQTWRYSDDGNLLVHAGRTLGYDEDRPHAARARRRSPGGELWVGG